MMVTEKLIPPDGGYGWFIVLAYGLHHFIAFPLMHGFGLIYKDTLKDLGLTATDTSLIINTNAAFSMFIGMMLGPLLKYLGYRKMALCGAFLTSAGVMLTAYAGTFAHFIMTYGLITAAGRGIGMLAYPLALNSYFQKKRVEAAGYVMTIFALGLIVMPQLISFLLRTYGVRSGVIVLSAVASHIFISSVLLQPVKRYMKTQIVEDNADQKKEEEKLLNKENSINKTEKAYYSKKLAASMSKINEEDVAKIGSTYRMDESMQSLYNALTERSSSISSKRSAQTSAKSNQTADTTRRTKSYSVLESLNRENSRIFKPDLEAERKAGEPVEERGDSLLKRIGKRIVDIFDLTLLCDLTFVNIAIGMGLSAFSEMNFSLLIPFIMQDNGLSTQQTATVMSTIAVLDIICRFIAPYVSNLLKQPGRIMYVLSLILPTTFRFSLLFAKSYASLLGCAILIGIAKGFQTVYQHLVVPSHVPIERLASAIGIQSTFTGIVMCFGGPFLGYIRDLTGSYGGCVVALNCVTSTTITLWTIEFVYKHYKSKRKT